MLSPHVAAAVSALQQQSQRTQDGFDLDRVDRALDELLRSPDKASPAAHQQRSALANATKVVMRRRAITNPISLDEPSADSWSRRVEMGMPDDDFALIDIYLWLETTPSLNPSERRLLQALAAGHDAHSLSARDGVPPATMRVRISRARATGWEAYQREVSR